MYGLDSARTPLAEGCEVPMQPHKRMHNSQERLCSLCTAHAPFKLLKFTPKKLEKKPQTTNEENSTKTSNKQGKTEINHSTQEREKPKYHTKAEFF